MKAGAFPTSRVSPPGPLTHLLGQAAAARFVPDETPTALYVQERDFPGQAEAEAAAAAAEQEAEREAAVSAPCLRTPHARGVVLRVLVGPIAPDLTASAHGCGAVQTAHSGSGSGGRRRRRRVSRPRRRAARR